MVGDEGLAPLHYAYLITCLFILMFWFPLFVLRRDLRKEMLIMSLLCLPIAVLELFYIRDYWQPDTLFGWVLGIENFMFCFSVGGIAAVIYEFLTRRRLYRAKDKIPPPLQLLLGTVLSNLVMFGSWLLLPINFMYASLLGMLTLIIVMLVSRRDLLRESLLSGVFFGVLYLAIFQLLFVRVFPGLVEKWWFHQNLSDSFVFGQPIEESLWAFLFGSLWGPAYEFLAGYKLRRRPAEVRK